MTEKKDPRPTRDAAQSPERIDPRSGLDRLKKAMSHLLKVPKEDRSEMRYFLVLDANMESLN